MTERATPLTPPGDLTVRPAPPLAVQASPDESLLDEDGFGGTTLLDDADAPMVDPATLRTMVAAAGGILNFTLGNDQVPDQWRFTERELDDLIPPLHRLVSRTPTLRAAVARGDEMALAVVLAGYVGRNYSAGRDAAELVQHMPATDEGADDGHQ